MKGIRRGLAPLRRVFEDQQRPLDALDARLRKVSGRIEEHGARQEELTKRLTRRIVKLEALMAEREAPRMAEPARLAEPIIVAGRSLLDLRRLDVLYQAARNAPPDAAAAEVGAYRGGSAAFLAEAYRALHGIDVELHVLDTFAGHPARGVGARDAGQRPGAFADTDAEDVARYLARHPAVQVHVADATADLAGLPERTYGLVHVDTDLYEPTLASLRYFAPRLAAGGVMVLDDYGAESCPGVAEALETYMHDADAVTLKAWHLGTEQAVLVRVV